MSRGARTEFCGICNKKLDIGDRHSCLDAPPISKFLQLYIKWEILSQAINSKLVFIPLMPREYGVTDIVLGDAGIPSYYAIILGDLKN